jgi:HEAT repeat protein
MTSGVPRVQAFAAVQFLLLHGKPLARRSAAEALNEFHGAEANALAVQAMEDDDPQVQANILIQLRGRGVVGALPRLLKLVDSPHAVIREAVRASLTEFSFPRFLAAFDMLDEEVRRSTGILVKKIDPQTVPGLRAELESPVRSRRLRALAVATAIDAVGSLEEMVAGLLEDRDASVRAEAARALGHGESRSRETWHGPLHDQGTPVQGEAT